MDTVHPSTDSQHRAHSPLRAKLGNHESLIYHTRSLLEAKANDAEALKYQQYESVALSFAFLTSRQIELRAKVERSKRLCDICVVFVT